MFNYFEPLILQWLKLDSLFLHGCDNIIHTWLRRFLTWKLCKVYFVKTCRYQFHLKYIIQSFNKYKCVSWFEEVISYANLGNFLLAGITNYCITKKIKISGRGSQKLQRGENPTTATTMIPVVSVVLFLLQLNWVLCIDYA